MPPLSVMFKTVSSDCNLDCSYCYYRQSLEGDRPRRRIADGLLELFLPRYMDYVADSHQANLSWQGGEPTLAGLDFFRKVVEIEARHAKPPMTVSNAIQTNGVLVNDEWVEFFAAYSFLVGVSLDGPVAIHDSVRRDRGGRGSFKRVMAGIEALRKQNVDLNVLCVVGPHNVGLPRELMSFYRREGLGYLQFIPEMAFQSTEPQKPPAYMITPRDYGQFLVALFDEWYGTGIPAVSVRTFDNFLQSMVGVNNDLCVHSGACDSGLVVEYNGDVFPCDFYIHPDWRLGNVLSDDLSAMLGGNRRSAFLRRRHGLPPACARCAWKNLCKGECPRNWQAGGGESYFCKSYRALFEHAAERLKTLADTVARYRKYLAWRSANPRAETSANGACPCGSGRMFKDCCGAPGLSGSYLFRR